MKKRILSTLLALCMVLALLPGTAWAADKSGNCGDRGDNVKWTLDSAGGLKITGSGNMESGVYTIKFPDSWISVVNLSIGDGVTNVGEQLFSGCKNLARVTLADSVRRIEARAFNNCERLALITMPQNLDHIGDKAFFGCKSLARITFPDSLTNIDPWAFAACSKLANIAIPGSVTSIGSNAFRECSNLTSAELSEGLKSLGSYGFFDCARLSEITLPNSLTSLGSWCFGNCTALKAIAIPESIDTLNEGLFSGCMQLASVTLPASVTMIGSKAFENCTALKDIYFAGTQRQWEDILIDENNNLSKVRVHYNSTGPSASKNYTVTFDATGGSVSTEEKTYEANAVLGTLPTPTRSGYKFDGWYTSRTGGTKVSTSTKVTGDMSLYAHWTKNPTTKTYTIKLDANSGTVSPSSLKVESGKTYLSSLPTPTRSGYKFDGWYTSRTGGTKITATTKATANRTIYAHWTRSVKQKTFLVTFNANGGMVDQDRKVVRTANLYGELPTPTKNNSHFQGWYTKKTGGTKVTETTRVNLTADQTLYARWQSSAAVRSTQRGTYRVTIPAYYDLALYASSSTAKISSQPEITASQTITCTQRATLSNGTVRYYGKVNGKTGWFTYSCEMSTK